MPVAFSEKLADGSLGALVHVGDSVRHRVESSTDHLRDVVDGAADGAFDVGEGFFEGYVPVKCWPTVLPGAYAEPQTHDLVAIQRVIGMDREHQHLTGT